MPTVMPAYQSRLLRRVFSQEGDALDFARKVLTSRDAKGNVHKVYVIEERTIFEEIVPP